MAHTFSYALGVAAVAERTRLANDVFHKWSDGIPHLLKEKLHQPLVLRESDSIVVNFDDQLETVIREVKHLIRLRGESCLPEEALFFYRQRDQLGEQRIVLKAIVDRYNELRAELLPIEMPLVQPVLHRMDALLLPGETTVIWSDEGNENWWIVLSPHVQHDHVLEGTKEWTALSLIRFEYKTDWCVFLRRGVSEYLRSVEDSSLLIHSQVQVAKKNLREIQDLCYAWGNNEPLLCEKVLPLDLATLKTGDSVVDEKLKPMMTDDGKRIHLLLQENKSLFGIEGFPEEWSNYVSFVDELVSEGLLYLIRRNLYFLLQATTPESGQNPVFMIHVHLDTFGLRFKPPLDKPKHMTLQHLLQSMVAGIFSATGLVPRVDDSQVAKEYVGINDSIMTLKVVNPRASLAGT
ncbi:dynein beta chain, ciliary [Trichonephila clavipes]|nr:dynein beta chain, ciliary [Trichonephila clavipes]